MLSKGLSRVFSSTQFKSTNSIVLSLLYGPILMSVHDYRKTIALTMQTFVGKVMSLLFNMLTRLVISFLPRSKRLLISWLQSPSAVILEPKKRKSITISIVSLSIYHEMMGLDAMICHYFYIFPFYLPWSDKSYVYTIIYYVCNNIMCKKTMYIP